jgi:hypothetical protein
MAISKVLEPLGLWVLPTRLAVQANFFLQWIQQPQYQKRARQVVHSCRVTSVTGVIVCTIVEVKIATRGGAQVSV